MGADNLNAKASLRGTIMRRIEVMIRQGRGARYPADYLRWWEQELTDLKDSDRSDEDDVV